MNINILIEKLEKLTNKIVMLEEDNEVVYSKYIKPIKIDERIKKFIIKIDDDKKELVYLYDTKNDIVNYLRKTYPDYNLIKQEHIDYIQQFITINGNELTFKGDVRPLELKTFETYYKNHIINVEGNVFFNNEKLKEIPIQFGYVKGNFHCYYNQLTSLIGCPQKVGKSFFINNNQLTSLIGCPELVGDDFSCDNNQLTSLEGCSKKIGGNFHCDNNQLTSLIGCPKKIEGSFWCRNNSKQFTEDEIRELCKIGGKIYI